MDQAKWREFGIPDVEITSHDTSLTNRDTQQLTPHNTTGLVDEVLHEAMLAENVTNDGDFIPAFFTGPGMGNVTAQFVSSFIFVNWGLKEDIDALHNANVSLEGIIAIMKSVQVSRSLENKN
ncbi:hypothetical protein MW887_005733 [Aspergillus wentii]|nr:hypothetical protein MW887_005733 [Aspergillus wentii]